MKKALSIMFALLLLFLLPACGGEEEDDDGGNDGDGGNSGNSDDGGWKTLGIINKICVDPNDNIYIAGTTDLYLDSKEQNDPFLASFNSKGEELWYKQWHIDDNIYGIQGLVISEEGNIYVGGGEENNSFVAKFSKDGEKLEEYHPNISGYIIDLAVDQFENIYIASRSMYGKIMKLSTKGEIVWEKDLSESQTVAMRTVAVDSDNNVYAGGLTWGDLFQNKSGDMDAFIVKFSPDGNQLWGKQWGSSSKLVQAETTGIVVDSNDNIYVLTTSIGEIEVLSKYTNNGDKVWGVNKTDTLYSAIAIDYENNLYLGGKGSKNDRIHKYNSNGEQVWTSNDKGSANWDVRGLSLDHNGNLYVGGTKNKENFFLKIPKSEMK